MPSIFSGSGIGFIDPHEQFFRIENPTKRTSYPTSSYLWSIVEDKEEIHGLEDQFAPFMQEVFGINNETFFRGFYSGTLFRFPLRTDNMVSDLCDTKYSAQKVRELFEFLEMDAHIMLLFLKSLESIEVYEKSSAGITPSNLMTIKISSDTQIIVRSKRQQLMYQIEERRATKELTIPAITESASVTYAMTTELNKPNSKPNTRQWLISQYFGGYDEIKAISCICNNLGLLPWVGVALPVDSNTLYGEPCGQIFCFLPLPLEPVSPTGLRIHVHGYFAVDSNRRHIKWKTADQSWDRVTDENLIWNYFLVSVLLPKAMINLALFLAMTDNQIENINPEIVYGIIPDIQKINEIGIPLALAFLKELPKLSIFYCSVGGGKYLQIQNALFVNIEDISKLSKLIRDILIQSKTNLVSVPAYVFTQLGSCAQQINASLVCSSLKNVQQQLILSDDDRLFLLKYFLEKLSGNFSELVGTKLLPLADGSWIEFQKSNQLQKVYIDSGDHPRTLLPGLEACFLKLEVQEACKTIAKQSKQSYWIILF